MKIEKARVNIQLSKEQNQQLNKTLSKRDQEIFFDAILNPKKPNNNLIKAALEYKEAIAGKGVI